MLDDADTVFVRLAGSKGWLDEEEIETLYGLQALDRMCGRRRTIAGLSVAEGMLSRDEAEEVLKGVRYYLVRQADKQYGRIAAERGLVPQGLIDGLLEDQRRAFHERHILQRLSRILLVAGVISADQDEGIKREVLGLPATPATPADVPLAEALAGADARR